MKLKKSATETFNLLHQLYGEKKKELLTALTHLFWRTLQDLKGLYWAVKPLMKTTLGWITCRHNNVKTKFTKPCLIIQTAMPHTIRYIRSSESHVTAQIKKQILTGKKCWIG